MSKIIKGETAFIEHYLKQLAQLPVLYGDHHVPYSVRFQEKLTFFHWKAQVSRFGREKLN
jgi:hypothetical protein